MSARPYIVGIGGSSRPNSSSERALRFAIEQVRATGAEVAIFTGSEIDLPMYVPGDASRSAAAAKLIGALRRADGIVLASPGYHGSISGLVKNALDYVEEMRDDRLPYFEGRAIGLIACAAGWQATGSTLSALRSIVHALRGWPTPLGAAINTIGNPFGAIGSAPEDATANQLKTLARQVLEFADARALRELARQEITSTDFRPPPGS